MFGTNASGLPRLRFDVTRQWRDGCAVIVHIRARGDVEGTLLWRGIGQEQKVSERVIAECRHADEKRYEVRQRDERHNTRRQRREVRRREFVDERRPVMR